MVRKWSLTEEAIFGEVERLGGFSDIFYIQFFPAKVSRIWNRSSLSWSKRTKQLIGTWHTAEFWKLSPFPPIWSLWEKNIMRRFQQWLVENITYDYGSSLDLLKDTGTNMKYQASYWKGGAILNLEAAHWLGTVKQQNIPNKMPNDCPKI